MAQCVIPKTTELAEESKPPHVVKADGEMEAPTGVSLHISCTFLNGALANPQGVCGRFVALVCGILAVRSGGRLCVVAALGWNLCMALGLAGRAGHHAHMHRGPWEYSEMQLNALPQVGAGRALPPFLGRGPWQRGMPPQ